MNIFLAQLTRARRLMSILTVAGLIGFTTYQISQITAVQADQDYLARQKASVTIVKLKPSVETLNQLRALQSAGDTSVPIRSGKNDPFSL